MGRVLLVRHGETSYNKGGESAERIRGWIDMPLDQDGYAEADRLAHSLKDHDIVEVFTSPLLRARDTALRISKAAHVGMRPNISLLPWNLGVLQGQLVKHAKTVMSYYVEHEDETPEGGEPFAQYRERFLEFVTRKMEEASHLGKDDFIVLVTHSRGLQITKAWEAAGTPDDLHISIDRMNDYSDETGTGGVLSLGLSQ